MYGFYKWYVIVLTGNMEEVFQKNLLIRHFITINPLNSFAIQLDLQKNHIKIN